MLRQWAFEDRNKIFPAHFASGKKQKRNDEYNKAVPKQVDGTAVKAEAAQDTFSSRFAFGQKVAGSDRMVDTPWEAKNVAPFSTSEPNYVPTRARIIVQQLWNISTSLVLREIVMEVEMSMYPSYTARSRVPILTRLDEVSREEVMVRLILGIGYWLFSYCTVQIVLGTIAVLFALSKPGKVRELRPMFGSLSEAYTVRGFWGKFWHQNLRNNLEGPSRFLTHRILRLPRGSLPARYSSIFFTFFLSGTLHIASDIGISVPPSQSGALRFFCTNALAIMLEDGVQELSRRLNGGKSPGGWWSRILGYVWVVVFLSWSTACWQYPQLRIVRREEDRILEFGVLRSAISDGCWIN